MTTAGVITKFPVTYIYIFFKCPRAVKFMATSSQSPHFKTRPQLHAMPFISENILLLCPGRKIVEFVKELWVFDDRLSCVSPVLL